MARTAAGTRIAAGTRTAAGRRFAPVNSPNALAFSGTTPYVTMGGSFDKERTDSFSISAWVNWNGPNAANQAVVAKNSGAATYRGYGAQLNVSGYMSFYLSNTNASNYLYLDSSRGLTPRRWHHCVWTYAGTSAPSGVNMYRDGIAGSNTIIGNNLTATTINGGAFTISSYTGGAGVNIFQGRIKDVRLYNAALTPAQVLDAMYLDRHVSVQAGWHISEGSGNTIAAHTGGVNGSMVTAPATWVTSVPPHYGVRGAA